jgi:hypothetical protein
MSAIRYFVENRKWSLNEKGSVIWLSEEGLFLIWRRAAKDIIEHLEREGMKGVPKDSVTLLNILCDARIIETGRTGDPYWEIYVPEEGAVPAVRFTHEDVVLAVFESVPPRLKTFLSNEQAASENPATVSDDARESSSPAPLPAEKSGTPEPASSNQDERQSSAESVGAKNDFEQSSAEVAKDACKKISDSPPKSVASSFQSARSVSKDSKGIVATLGREIKKGSGKLPDDDGFWSKMKQQVDRLVFKSILEDWMSGAIDDACGVAPVGLCIPVEIVNNYGVNASEFIMKVNGNGWLYTSDTDRGKKVFLVSIGGEDRRCMIIKLSIAKDMGFI